MGVSQQTTEVRDVSAAYAPQAAVPVAPKGYKQTEVGVIPEDWRVDYIENFAQITTGGKNTQDRKMDGQYPFFVRSQTVERIDSYSFDGEAVLTAGDGVGTGKVFHYIKGRFDVHQRVYQIYDFSGDVDGYFFYLYFSANFYSRIMQMTAKSSVDSVRRDMIARMLVPLPPTVEEQRAIATALSDVDALLEGLDRLIAKKRDLKQAAMQQLLTGQTRLPGFEGEWEVKRLGETGVFLKGSGVKKDEASSGDIPCIRYGEIYTYHHDYIRSFNSWISSEVAATATRLRQGDLLFAGSGETKEEIGKCVAFIDDFEAYAGGDIVILRLTGANPVFMGYYCNTAPINSQKASKGQGDAVVHISAAALASIEVTLPSHDEQTAIATVLADMDTEIEALEQRRAKTRDLKQAMMQELLTGRTRLI
jgi:type I restriction enzyme S subunit